MWGLVRRKELWLPSWRGWLVAFAALVGLGWVALANSYSFLAVNRPVPTDVLVVEGWLDDWAFRAAAEDFRRGNYRIVFVTGGPVPGNGGYVNDFQTFASVGAERLIAFGVPRHIVQIVPARDAVRDRTYASAVVLKRWFHEHHFEVRALNIMTQTTHARRTRLLFQKALGPEIEIGVIPLFSPDFKPHDWWRYSEGARDVISEAIAYAYALLFFSPQE
jgi:hypothetical protein